MVAVVNFDLWRQMRRQWLAMLEQRSQEMYAGKYVTQEQLDAELSPEIARIAPQLRHRWRRWYHTNREKHADWRRRIGGVYET
jgi:hypothetical protein